MRSGPGAHRSQKPDALECRISSRRISDSLEDPSPPAPDVREPTPYNLESAANRGIDQPNRTQPDQHRTHKEYP
jgi:hypothetical protein